MRRPPLTRKVLDGINSALCNAEADPDGFVGLSDEDWDDDARRSWSEVESALAWVGAMYQWRREQEVKRTLKP